MSDHRLDYEAQTSPDGKPGFLASCQCRDFHAWVGTTDPETELALLTLHQLHADHPDWFRKAAP